MHEPYYQLRLELNALRKYCFKTGDTTSSTFNKIIEFKYIVSIVYHFEGCCFRVMVLIKEDPPRE